MAFIISSSQIDSSSVKIQKSSLFSDCNRAKIELKVSNRLGIPQKSSRMTTPPSNSIHNHHEDSPVKNPPSTTVSAQSVSSSGSMGSPSEQTTTVATTPASDDPASQLASGYVKLLYFPPLFFDLGFHRTYHQLHCVCVYG